MSIVTLATAKAHLRVDTSDEDTLIQLYLNASEISANNYLARTIYVTEQAKTAADDEDGVVMNDAIRSAILLQLGTLYRDREATAERPTSELAMGAKYLLDPYRVLEV